MDVMKLIEEAEREIAHMKAETLSAANPYNENTIRLTLIIDLAAALKASEERARKAEDERDEIAAGLRSSSNLNFAMRQERDSLAAANLAANKRIVELEHERDAARAELARLTTERDEWMRRSEGWESEAAIVTERYNRLATAQPSEPLDMDCGDSSCAFAKTRGGMRTNGGCRCLANLGFDRGQTDSLRKMAAEIVAMRKRLSDLTTPRPIAEAPKDGTWIVGFWDDAPPKVIRRWAEQWRDYMGASVAWRGLTHFLPLPVLP